MSIRFPDVPSALGVPAVFRAPLDVSRVLAGVPGIAAGARRLIGPIDSAVNAYENVKGLVDTLTGRAGLPDSFAPDLVTWGIYDSGGALALEADNVMALEPFREFRISDYPVEKGGFESYNKVATPAETRVTMTKGGSEGERQAFQDALDRLIETTELYSVVAADRVYLNRNIVRYDMRRTAEQGATLLTFEVQLIEVRQDARAAFSDTKAPSGASPSNNGPVQAVPAPVGATAAFI